MARNPSCTVYVGNLDEKVTDRILYEILIQVGRVVDLYVPLDKERNRHKGYAFAEYESEQIADYAVKLFSGLVRLHNRTLKFAISGQDKPSQNTGTLVTPKTNSIPQPRPHFVQGREVEMFQGSAQSTDGRVPAYAHPVTPVTPVSNSPLQRPYPPHIREMAMFPGASESVNCRVSAYSHSLSPGYYPSASARGFLSNGLGSSNLDYDRRVFGSMLTNANHPDYHRPVLYPSYSNH